MEDLKNRVLGARSGGVWIRHLVTEPPDERAFCMLSEDRLATLVLNGVATQVDAGNYANLMRSLEGLGLMDVDDFYHDRVLDGHQYEVVLKTKEGEVRVAKFMNPEYASEKRVKALCSFLAGLLLRDNASHNKGFLGRLFSGKRERG